MAEIPVEKRSSNNWLWILLALLLVALLAWWLLSDDEEEVVYDDTVATAPVAPVTEGLVVGQQIDMDGVTVTSLAGDMAFYIEMNGQQVPVFFDQVPTPNDPTTEGRYDINPGTVVNITGEVRSATAGLPENADPSILGASENYIWADDVEPVG